MQKITALLFALLLIIACSNPQVPSDYEKSDRLPDIYPDYTGVTIPVNMAPLHFQLMGDWTDENVITRFTASGAEDIVCQGFKVRPEIRQWRQLADAAKGGNITVEVFTRDGERWTRLRPFAITVSPDSIDPWLSYRLISPSYVTFEELTINQRHLESFEERIIYSNMLCSTESEGQCINCHSYQQGNPDRMQMHARLNHGGTLIMMDGKPTKVNLKTDSTISAGVYPAWHPTLPLIAYSTDKTLQMFHTLDVNKVEVLDAQSDLILYDIEKNQVSIVENRKDEFEVFPAWSPDGRWLYYSSAHFEPKDSLGGGEEAVAIRQYQDIKYNVYRKAFDSTTMTFGPRELVFDAAAQGLSATLPRVSPDGRLLLITVGGWGCFHIWHRDADLWLVNLATNEARPWKEVNSDNVESYHTWSQSGRWVVFSSRRYDGNYTRPFFAHVDANGHASKPFELPCDDPDQHRQMMKSYNIPEFMVAPVTISPQKIADALKNEPVQAVLK